MHNVDVGREPDQGINLSLPQLARFDQDLRFILVDKAEGDDLTNKVNNVKDAGGVQLYGTLYQWFTETSGLGRTEQARKLLDPPQAKKEEDILVVNERGFFVEFSTYIYSLSVPSLPKVGTEWI